MSIVGPDGQTPVVSEAKLNDYAVGGVQVKSAETPEEVLHKALSNAQTVVAQQAGAAAFQKSQSHVVAQAEAQQAAMSVTNPFHIEPAALALFMLMSREIKHRNSVIAALAERLDKLDGQSSEELLKSAWLDLPEVAPENEAEKSGESEGANADAFSQAAENLKQLNKDDSN